MKKICDVVGVLPIGAEVQTKEGDGVVSGFCNGVYRVLLDDGGEVYCYPCDVKLK